MIWRIWAGIAGAALMASAIYSAPIEGSFAAAGGAFLMLNVLGVRRARTAPDPRRQAIERAATALAHAFALTDRPCLEETRAVSRAVFLGKE